MHCLTVRCLSPDYCPFQASALEFVSIAANRLSGCVSWSRGCHRYAISDISSCTLPALGSPATPREGLVAFGAGNFVSLYDPQVCAARLLPPPPPRPHMRRHWNTG